jgi:hypothetical protein
MNPKLFILFNHQIAVDQQTDARSSLAVSSFVEPPQPIQKYLTPVKRWLSEQAKPGDYLLVQGDFGATYLMVCFAFKRGIVPVYSTTERQVSEDRLADGTVKATHAFRHRCFRTYGR